MSGTDLTLEAAATDEEANAEALVLARGHDTGNRGIFQREYDHHPGAAAHRRRGPYWS